MEWTPCEVALQALPQRDARADEMTANAWMHVWLGAVLLLVLGCDNVTSTPRPPRRQETPGSQVTKVARGKLEFVQGYADGYQQARYRKRPMLVFFTASWCGYCHQMEAEAFNDGQVARLSRQFVCILVDADQEPDVCREFRIHGFPAIQFLTPQGVPLNRLVGKQSAAELMFQMQAALEATANRSSQNMLR
jgi:thiol:disulfide interchange protein